MNWCHCNSFQLFIETFTDTCDVKFRTGLNRTKVFQVAIFSVKTGSKCFETVVSDGRDKTVRLREGHKGTARIGAEAGRVGSCGRHTLAVQFSLFLSLS